MSEMELVTVWSGDSWRQYPQPVVAEPSSAKGGRESQAGAALARYSAREMVYACVDTCFHSVNGVRARTGLSDRRVRFVLMTGAMDGTLERIEQAPARPGLRPTYLYRRVTTRREQAV